MVAQHVGEGHLRAAEEVAAGGDADVDGRPALERQALEAGLAALVLGHHLVLQVGLEVDALLGQRAHLLVDLGHRVDQLEGLQQELALEVGDEAQPRAALAAQHDGRHVAAQHVGPLAHHARAQVQAAQVVDVALLGGGVVERLPVGREVRGVVVERAEGQLGAPGGVVQREEEDLGVAADAARVGHQPPVGGDARVAVAVGVVGEVLELLGLEVEQVDVLHALLEAHHQRPAAVGQQARGLQLVQRRGDLLLDRAVQGRGQHQAAALARAGDEGHLVAARGEVDGPRRGEVVGQRDALVGAREAAGQVAHQRAVAAREQHQVELLVGAVGRQRGHQLARGAGGRREDLGQGGVVLVGREVPAVVRGALLVAVGLEALLEPLVEGLVELLGLDAEGLLVDVVELAAHHVLAPGVQELAQPLLAPALGDELEGGVAQVVDQAPGERLELGLGELRHLLGHGRVAHHHQVERVPGAAHVVGQALVDPQRHGALQQGARDQVELEDVGQLVGDQPLQLVGRLVDGDDHPVAHRLGEGRHPFRDEVREQVGLLELRVGLVEDDRDRARDLVLELARDLLVAALQVRRQPAQVLLELGVVVDLEVGALVDAPLELVVADLVLAVVRHELGPGRRAGQPQAQGQRQAGRPAAEVAHRPSPPHGSSTRVPRMRCGVRTPRKFGSSRSISSK